MNFKIATDESVGQHIAALKAENKSRDLVVYMHAIEWLLKVYSAIIAMRLAGSVIGALMDRVLDGRVPSALKSVAYGCAEVKAFSNLINEADDFRFTLSHDISNGSNDDNFIGLVLLFTSWKDGEATPKIFQLSRKDVSYLTADQSNN